MVYLYIDKERKMTAGGFLTAFFVLILLVVIFAVVSVVGTVASISGAIEIGRAHV